MDRKEEVLQAFGQRLAAIRKEKKTSLRELTAATGIKETQLKKIEAGKVNILFTTVIILSKALSVNPEELLQTLAPE